MGVAGPRLDRPSAVGDEGRPRAASQLVAVLVTLAIASATGYLWGLLGSLTLLCLVVGLFVVGLGLLGRSHVGPQIVGHVTYHAGALGVVTMLVLVVGGSSRVLTVGGLFVALLGIAASWANVLARDQLEEATRRAAISYVAVLGWLFLLAVGLVGYAAADYAVTAILDATGAAASLFGALGLLAVAGLLLRAACGVVPVAALAPRGRLARYQAVTSRLALAGTVTAGVAVLGILLAAVYGQTRIDAIAASTQLLGAILHSLSSPPVVLGLTAISAGCLLVALAGGVLREVASLVDAGNYDLLAGLVGGLLLTGIVLQVAIGGLPVGSTRLPVDQLVGFGLIAPIVTIVVGYVTVAAIDWGAVPRRAAGPALAAVGLIWTGIGVALGNMPGVLVFACVAGAMVVWDCSTFGLGLTVELGHRPETRRLELYHGVLSVGVGVATVAVATALEWLRGHVGDEIGAWPAVALAVLGAVLIAVAIHRREP